MIESNEILVLNTLSNECSCPNCYLTYECTVTSANQHATYWNGTAFNCSNEESLLHSNALYLSNVGHTENSCNNGSIEGKTINHENSTYTSQINVTLNFNIIGRNIECFHFNTTTAHYSQIGSSLIKGI